MKKFIVCLTTFCLLFIALAIFQITHGSIHLSLSNLFQTLSGSGSSQNQLVLFQFRLPPIVLSLICGTCLSLSGAILQLVTENPLADTSIMGINAGASLGAVAFLAAGHNLSPMFLPLFAVVGSMVGASLVFFQRRIQEPMHILLIGIASTSLLNGIILLVEFQLNQFDFAQLIVWISGDFWNLDWSYLAVLVVACLILFPIATFALGSSDILGLGAQAAHGVGMNVKNRRQWLMVIAVLLAAIAVAGGGAISFVGLMAPHIARQLVGHRGRFYLPVTVLLGVNLVLFANVVAENLFAPNQLPVGLVVAVITLPYFIYLLLRQTELR